MKSINNFLVSLAFAIAINCTIITIICACAIVINFTYGLLF